MSSGASLTPSQDLFPPASPKKETALKEEKNHPEPPFVIHLKPIYIFTALLSIRFVPANFAFFAFWMIILFSVAFSIGLFDQLVEPQVVGGDLPAVYSKTDGKG